MQVPPVELAGIVSLQALLCIFNVFVTWRSFAGWLRNRKAAAAAAAGTTEAAAAAAPQSGTAHQLSATGSNGQRRHSAGLAPPTAHVSIAGVPNEMVEFRVLLNCAPVRLSRV